MYPKTIKYIDFKLAPTAQLEISKGFFRDRKIHRLQVHGGMQIELTTHAMDGNNAQCPQIIINSCKNVVLRERVFHDEFELNITNALSAIVYSNAFEGCEFIAHFLRIGDLRIHDGALAGAIHNSRIKVMDSHMSDLWPLQASMKEILFQRTTIDKIQEKAFNSPSVKLLEFESCTIGEIEPNAFTNNVSKK